MADFRPGVQPTTGSSSLSLSKIWLESMPLPL